MQECEHDVMPQRGTVYGWNGLESDGQSSSDFPLTAYCRCGRVIIRESPAVPWCHRRDDEPPVSEPASGGWLAMLNDSPYEVPVLIPAHQIVPRPGTVTREQDGQSADMFAPLDFPLLARCITCGGLVREERWFASKGWVHIQIPQPRHT